MIKLPNTNLRGWAGRKKETYTVDREVTGRCRNMGMTWEPREGN